MTLRPNFFSIPGKVGLSPEQIAMYSQERMMNFRWVSRVMATYSHRTLTDADAAPADVAMELSEFGQFAEVAFGTVPTEYIFDHLDKLLEPDFPLEGYEALRGSVLISYTQGKVANLDAYVAYRPNKKQLIVATSGTSNIKQAFQDVRTWKHKHPVGRGCAVHAGFWKMYKGVRTGIIQGIEKGLKEHNVSELAITGHSMGGAVSHLLAIDLLNSRGLPPQLHLKIAVLGAPRCGNSKLLQYWFDLTKEYRFKNGEDSLKEYSVKAYNDGVPSLPPKIFGFRHFTVKPLYLMKGRLYQAPPSESEFCLFHVSGEKDDEGRVIPHPLGGHNYYFLDMEKFWRRMGWMLTMMSGEGWEERYRAKVAKRERGWVEKTK